MTAAASTTDSIKNSLVALRMPRALECVSAWNLDADPGSRSDAD